MSASKVVHSAVESRRGLARGQEGARLLRRGDGFGPLRQVADWRGFRLAAEEVRFVKGLGDDSLGRRSPRGSELRKVGPAAAAQEDETENRSRQGDGEAQAVAFDAGPLGGFLGAGFLLGAGDLGLAQPLLHAGPIGVDPRGDLAGVARAVFELGGKAILGQGDQLGIGCR